MTIEAKISEEKFLTSLFYFFKTIGLSSASLNKKWLGSQKGSSRRPLFLPSKNGIAYNVLLLCILSVTNGYVIQYFYKASNKKGILFENVMDTIQTVLSFYVSVIVVLTHCCRQSSIVTLANMANCIRDLSADRNYIQRKSLARSIGKILLLNFVSWSLVIVTTVISYSFEVIVCRVISYYICSLIINAVFLQYVVVLKVIRQLFAQINDDLHQVSRQQSNAWMIAEIHCSKYQKCTRQTNILDRLTELQKRHSVLSEISRDVSDFFSMQMFLCTSYVFFTTIHVFYYVGKPLILRETGLDWDEYSYCIAYIFIYLSSLSILTNSVNAVVLESKKSGDIISDCMLNTESKQMLKKLTTFSFYLLHKEPKFTVYGLFSLDESLMISIAGSITTYLVIVLQFQENSYES